MSIAGAMRRTTVETNIDSRSKERKVSGGVSWDLGDRNGRGVGVGFTKEVFGLEAVENVYHLLGGFETHLDEVSDTS